MTATGIALEQIDGIEVFHLVGYVEAERGAEILNRGLDLVKAGSRRFLLDFSACPLVNSTGMVSILNLATKVVFEYHGCLVISGLDEKKEMLFEMLGVFRAASLVETVPEGLEKARAFRS